MSYKNIQTKRNPDGLRITPQPNRGLCLSAFTGLSNFLVFADNVPQFIVGHISVLCRWMMSPRCEEPLVICLFVQMHEQGCCTRTRCSEKDGTYRLRPPHCWTKQWQDHEKHRSHTQYHNHYRVEAHVQHKCIYSPIIQRIHLDNSQSYRRAELPGE